MENVAINRLKFGQEKSCKIRQLEINLLAKKANL